jgi:hypothetical protein
MRIAALQPHQFISAAPAESTCAASCEVSARVNSAHHNHRQRSRRLAAPRRQRYAKSMYDNFHVTDRWSKEDLHCRWKGTMVAIATRHADAVDIRFDVNGRPMWIAMPCLAWVEQKKRSGKVITDQLAAQIAGRYLKQLIEEGYDSRREVYTMTVTEVLAHLDAVVAEAKQLGEMPSLPVGA